MSILSTLNLYNFWIDLFKTFVQTSNDIEYYLRWCPMFLIVNVLSSYHLILLSFRICNIFCISACEQYNQRKLEKYIQVEFFFLLLNVISSRNHNLYAYNMWYFLLIFLTAKQSLLHFYLYSAFILIFVLFICL